MKSIWYQKEYVLNSYLIQIGIVFLPSPVCYIIAGVQCDRSHIIPQCAISNSNIVNQALRDNDVNKKFVRWQASKSKTKMLLQGWNNCT